MQMELFDFSSYNPVRLDELFTAYYDCRKNKRKTFNALDFEGDFETRLVKLVLIIRGVRFRLLLINR